MPGGAAYLLGVSVGEIHPGEDPLRRGAAAPPPRTLVDILRATVAAHPDATALDNGATMLTYAEFDEAATELAEQLAELGIGAGDKVGVRVRSGSVDLYVAIAGVLLAGAAYVPVDAEDPPERASTVFGEAEVAAVVGDELLITPRGPQRPPIERHDPSPDDDCWVIFTSGSTGKPKGVAVSHRSGAAFVDAEARIFLPDKPIGPSDRVMAGLSVAFDASCEEMWLAWRYGAALVPAPRSLVRSGVDLGPWLVANEVTVVSTVPTLVALWPGAALARVRLLILGGEACPPELAARLTAPGRQVWNTYGPTEATVVACAAPLTGTGPVRIGLPLDGWDLAVVDPTGAPLGEGEAGELIIGGVGLARYLDPAKDAQMYAAMPTLGWERAYRSGDLVRNEAAGLVFLGRADDQVKVGGRRIELGEIDNSLLALPGVTGAAAAVRATPAGTKILVGYLTVDTGGSSSDTAVSSESGRGSDGSGGSAAYDPVVALELLRAALPAALVPRLAVVDTLPTRTSGKIDRDALPWPLAQAAGEEPALALDGTVAWVRDCWVEVLGADPTSLDDDFFDLGGSSLASAELVSRLRSRFPDVTVPDLYDHPTLAGLAAHLDAMEALETRLNETVHPVARKTQWGQVLAQLLLRTVGGLRWLAWLAVGLQVLAWWTKAPVVALPDWRLTLAGVALFLLPPGRMLLAAAGARVLLRGIRPGDHPRGGRVHLRVWCAERLADELGATNISGAGLIPWYARLLGANIGRDAQLHSLPPVTGMLTLGRGACIDPEVDLSGHWLDGATFHLGAMSVGKGARVGSRTTLGPGARIGDDAEIAPGSAVFGPVPDGEFWAGAPAEPTGRKPAAWARDPAPNRPLWRLGYATSALAVAAVPVFAAAAALWVTLGARATTPPPPRPGTLTMTTVTFGPPAPPVVALLWRELVVGAAVWALVVTVLVLLAVRLVAPGVREGRHPVHSASAWAVWTTVRVLDEARTWLFPLYSSALTPMWLRALGARVGRDVEASTVLLVPKLTWINDGAFCADDTLLGGYELGGGWLRTDRVKVGKHAFLGNSGMTAPGRRIRRGSLVAVLSAAPRERKAKAGSSWLGSPPEPLRRHTVETESARTTAPPTRLRVARALVEAARFVALVVDAALYAAAVAALWQLAALSWWLAAALAGVVLLVAGAVAAVLSTAAKWLLVGRLRKADHPLWSSFVWRNELADTFVEVLGAPWFARPMAGSPPLVWWLRSLGARIGHGVWCDTYWLPEADLVTLSDGATVNRGCVVQTHLFHDRVFSMDAVTLRTGATLGPNGVVLPAATIGRHATVGPASLVMRGESVPDRTRWIGNPIRPWSEAPALTVPASSGPMASGPVVDGPVSSGPVSSSEPETADGQGDS